MIHLAFMLQQQYSYGSGPGEGLNMKWHKWGLAALGLTLGLSAANSAPPATDPADEVANAPVEISGNVYHRAVCGHGRPVAGEARCHAHVVTDARGNVKPGKSVTANLLTAPSGYSPAVLR